MAALLVKPWRVLVVDDDTVSARIIHDKIQAILPNACIQVCSSAECVKTATLPLDIVFMDQFLGDEGDGIELCRFLIGAQKKPRPVFVSVSSETVGDSEMREVYALHWPKPLPGREEMARSLESALAHLA